MDLPIVPVSDRRASVGQQLRARGRPPIQDLLLRDGPASLVVLVAVGGGRWSAELRGLSDASRQLHHLVQTCLAGQPQPASLGVSGLIVGLAVLQGWHFVYERASHEHTYALMVAEQAHSRGYSRQRYLEHAILASARLTCGSAVHVPSKSSLVNPWSAGRQELRHLEHLNARVSVTMGQAYGEVLHIAQVIQMWQDRFQVDIAKCIPWCVDTDYALAMASGQWYGDITSVHRRASIPRAMLTLAPSPRVLGQFLVQCSDAPKPPLALEKFRPVRDEGRGFVKGFHARHLVAAVRAATALRSQELLTDQLRASLSFLAPWLDLRRPIVEIVEQASPPSGRTMHRARMRLDMVAMLFRRREHRASRPLLRYLAYDASPMKGTELFVTVERVIRPADIIALPSVDVSGQHWPRVEQRILPVVVLGCGRMGVAEKLQAHLHQTWLEYGPTTKDVRLANDGVRSGLSDMGHELAIADARDVLDACLGVQARDPLRASDWVYRYALTVPGPQHIIDGVLRAGIDSLPWWPAWEEAAKVVCQWLQPIGHRDLLQPHAQRACGSAAERARRAGSLETGCDRFAAWRWQTLF